MNPACTRVQRLYTPHGSIIDQISGRRSVMEQEGRLFVEGINVLNGCDGCDGRLYRGVLLLLPMT